MEIRRKRRTEVVQRALRRALFSTWRDGLWSVERVKKWSKEWTRNRNRDNEGGKEEK